MAFTYQIDSDAGLLLAVGSGVITQAERLATIQTWLADPAFRPGLPTLCDFSAATSTPTLPELREIVALIENHTSAIGRKKLAVVVGAPVTFGVARQFQALSELGPLTVQIFKDRDAALAWLRP